MLTTEVENFPGFPDGIMGPELMANMRKQAEKFGAEVLDLEYIEGDLTKSGGPFKIKAGDRELEGKTVILATGADTKWLGVAGEAERIGHGVSSCAPCDAFFFKNKNVIVVGGGDSAMEEALVLTKFAMEVSVIYRGETLRASEIMQKRAMDNPKIKFIFNTEVKEIMGEGHVSSVKLVNSKTNNESEMLIDGVFVAIGHMPNTKALRGIDLDEKGYIKAYDHAKTNVSGVFTAGDVHDRHFKQAITAAGFGCMAALEVERYLDEIDA
jgi:thioredoxin reductase (NADPH)